MKYDYQNVDILILLPCPMKAGFGRLANQIVMQFSEETGTHVNFLPVSAMDPEIQHDLMSIECAEEFPAVMILPGFGIPYTETFKRRFRDTGCFTSILEPDNETFRRFDFCDPKCIYDIIGVAPIAFFADRTYHTELTLPKSWHDLLTDPQYHRMVGMPGRETAGFQDFPIMAAYHLYREAGVLALAKTARCCLLPAEMVRMAGSRRDLAPAVGILNLSMARAAAQKSRMTEFIWPEEGLFCNPITMLTKSTAPEHVRSLARRLAGPETAGAFRIGGFYSAADPEPLGDGKLFWHGWDFIEKTDIPSLSVRLSRLMLDHCDLIDTSQAQKGG